MARTIATCTGYDRTRMKQEHRLGSLASKGQASTWKTFAVCYIERDGSGFIQVTRDGVELHRYTFGAE